RGRPGKETTRPYLQHFAKETEGSYIVLVVNRLHDASVLEADAIKKDKFFAKKIGEYVSVRRPEGAGSVKVGYMQNPYMAEGIYLLEFSYEPNEYNVQKNLESAAVWEHFKSSDRNPDAEPVSGDIDLGEDTEVSTGTTLKVANAGNVRVSAPRPVVPVVPLAPVDTRSDEVKLTEKSVAPAPVVRSEPVARPEPVVPPVLADTRSDDQKLAELKERSKAFKALCDAKNPDKKTLTDRYNELKELIKKTVFSDQAIKDMVDSFTPVLDNQFREASLQI
ncbi:hypothetical protein KKA47_03255, partial [bacterium]|nr:hypothetical protein [bacterium]